MASSSPRNVASYVLLFRSLSSSSSRGAPILLPSGVVLGMASLGGNTGSVGAVDVFVGCLVAEAHSVYVALRLLHPHVPARYRHPPQY